MSERRIKGPTRTTVQLGNRAPLKIESAIGGFDPVAAFSTATTGIPARSYLARLRGGGRYWTFAAAPLWRLHLRDRASGAILTRLPADFTTEAFTATSSGWTATWTGVTALAGDVSTVQMTAVLDADGTIRVTSFVVTLDATATHQGATHSVGKVDPLYLEVEPVAKPTQDKARLVIPAWSGHVVPDIHGTTTLKVMPYPGFLKGYPDQEVNDQNGNAMGHAQYIALEHPPSKTCLVLRCDDQDWRTKVFQAQGLTGRTSFFVTCYPEDNLNTSTWTMPFDVWLKPMAGDWWDIATWYRGRCEAEAMPFLSRGKRKDNGTALTPISQAMMDEGFFFWVNLTDDPTGNLAWVMDEISRVLTYRPGVNFVVRLDLWHANAFALNWPDTEPLPAEAYEAVTTIQSIGGKCVLYYIDLWGKNSVWYTGGYSGTYGNPASQVIHDRTGAAPVWPLDVPPADPDGEHYLPNYDNANAMAYHLEVMDSAFTKLVPDGVYDDAMSGAARWDYRATLGAPDKGPGSAAFVRGMRALADEKRTLVRGIAPDGIMLSEHMTEWALDRYCGLGVPTTLYNLFLTGFRWLPLWSATWNEYVVPYGYDIYGTWTQTTPADYYEAFYWNAAQNWLWGKKLGFVQNPVANGHIVVDPSEAGYTYYLANTKPYLDFCFDLVAARTSHGLGPYLRGRRLRPLPGSFDRYSEDPGLDAAFGLTDDGLFVKPIYTRGMTSVWQSDEDAQQPLAILLCNPSAAAWDFELVIDPADYPLVRNVSGSGKKKDYFVERTAGGRSLVRRFGGVLRHTVTVPARGFRVFELLETAP